MLDGVASRDRGQATGSLAASTSTSKDPGDLPADPPGLGAPSRRRRAQAERARRWPQFLDYVAGPGQVPGDEVGRLPDGHAPLTAGAARPGAAGPRRRARRARRAERRRPTARRPDARRPSPTDPSDAPDPTAGAVPRQTAGPAPADADPVGRTRRPAGRGPRRDAAPTHATVASQSRRGAAADAAGPAASWPCRPAGRPARCCGSSAPDGGRNGYAGERAAPEHRSPPWTPRTPAAAYATRSGRGGPSASRVRSRASDGRSR